MARKRIQVSAEDKTDRRVELAVAKHEAAESQYCLEPIRHQLVEDELLERQQDRGWRICTN